MNKLITLLAGDWISGVTTALGLAAVVGGLWFGFQHWKESIRQEGRDEINLIRQQENAERKAVADQAALENRAEEVRRRAAQQEIIDEATRKTEQARGDAGAARGAHGRLQQRFAALASGGCRAAQDTASAEPGAPASGTGDLRANVFRRIDDAAGQFAAYADSARNAGDACKQSYDSLNK